MRKNNLEKTKDIGNVGLTKRKNKYNEVKDDLEPILN